tara:strand:+ start:304 stop:576 length:273 start_codon:yes stop_codon:yes gene_type:complete
MELAISTARFWQHWSEQWAGGADARDWRLHYNPFDANNSMFTNPNLAGYRDDDGGLLDMDYDWEDTDPLLLDEADKIDWIFGLGWQRRIM